MIVRKIANYNSGKRVDKSTVIRRVEGATGYIFRNGQYVRSTEKDVDLSIRKTRRLVGSDPRDLSVIWFKGRVSAPVNDWGLESEYMDGTDCFLNFQFMYQFQIDYGEEDFDGNEMMEFYDKMLDLARLDLDFDPSIGAEGDHGIVSIPDSVLDGVIGRFISRSLSRIMKESYPDELDSGVLANRCCLAMNNDPFLLNHMIRIVYLRLESGAVPGWMLQEKGRMFGDIRAGKAEASED